MSVVVTGATGKLGRLVIEDLLRRGLAPDGIVAAGRAVERIADLADQGVIVRRIDFDDSASLREAFVDARKVLLVSGSELGDRVRLHGNAVDAAKQAGVELLVYTSIPKADTSGLILAREHKATEERIRDCGLTYTFLRNSWYLDLYTEALPTTLANGGILGCASDGRLSAALRADYAAAAAAVLAGSGHENAIYELGGDEAFTLAELAAEIERQAGKPVNYRDLAQADYVQTLVGFGLPAEAAAAYADGDRGIAAGELFVDSHHLSQLIGRPTTSMADAIAAAL